MATLKHRSDFHFTRERTLQMCAASNDPTVQAACRKLNCGILMVEEGIRLNILDAKVFEDARAFAAHCAELLSRT